MIAKANERVLFAGETVCLCVVDRWGEIVEIITESPESCELCTSKKAGFDVATQDVVLEGFAVARVAVQYSRGCFPDRAVEAALEKSSVFLGRYLAKALNRDQKRGGN